MKPIETVDKCTTCSTCSGKVQSVQLGEIEAEVLVTLDEGTTVCAVVTSQSARVLKLEPGKPVSVLFKAFAVVLGM